MKKTRISSLSAFQYSMLPEQRQRLRYACAKKAQKIIWSLDHVSLFCKRTFLNSGVNHVGLPPRNEVDSILRQLAEPHIIVIAAVDGQDRTRFQAQVPRYIQLAVFASTPPSLPRTLAGSRRGVQQQMA